MKRQVRGVGVGTVSLVMIFAVLCLTVFSMLTLSTSNAEKVMADKTSEYVKGYYQADSQATLIYAQILTASTRGVIPKTVDGIEIQTEDSGSNMIVSYACPVSDVQELFVRFKPNAGQGEILTWTVQPTEDWEIDNSMFVWDGNFEIE